MLNSSIFFYFGMFRLVYKMDRKPEVMSFYPKMDEFKDFSRFIQHIEDVGAHKVGLAKVLSKDTCSCYVHFFLAV